MKINAINYYKNIPLQAKASISYTLANLISKGVSIITVPIFTRILSTAQIGIGTVYTSWYSLLYSIVTLSLTSGSVNIAMMEYSRERDKYESTCLTLTTITGVIFLLFSLCFLDIFCKITTLSKPLIMLLSFSLIFNPALDFWYARQRYEYKYKSSVIISISITILSAIFSIIAVLVVNESSKLDLGEIKVLTQGVVLICFSGVIYFYILSKGRTIVDLQIWKKSLSWSLPLIIHSLSKNILDLSDRLMISFICGKEEAGIYGVVYSLSMLPLIFWNAINTSLVPTTFEKIEKKEYKELNSIIIKILFIFGLITILLTLFAPELLFLFTTSEYFSAVSLVPALSAGIFFTALYNIYGNLILYKKKTIFIMIGTLFAAFLNIILNFVFINLYGYTAAAYTTLMSFIILALIQCLIARKLFGKSIIDDKRIFVFACTIILICLSANMLYNNFVLRYVLIIVMLLVLLYNRKGFIKLLTQK